VKNKGVFYIIPKETWIRFRIRLLIYTLAHLLAALAVSTYLMLTVGILAATGSWQLNSSTSFIWAYPSYTIIVIMYLIEMYSFLTKNHKEST